MAMQKVLSMLAGLGPLIQRPEQYGIRASCVSSDGLASTGFMTQWIDHSNHSLGTFQQGIQINTEYFEPGGPILLFQGEESRTMTCVETTSLHGYARQLGGIVASIEHRYFGQSAPFGPEESYTNEGFKYLTLDNIMDDAVKFIKEIQQNVTGAANSRTIVASGSYGAFLTTAFRLNRPDDFYGAISCAPPTNVFLVEDGKVPGRFGWWNWISKVILERSAVAASIIKEAFQSLEDAIAKGDAIELQRKLNLCRVPDHELDHQKIIEAVMQSFSLVTEFNYPYVSPGRTPIANPFDKLIDTVLANKHDPFKMLQATHAMWFQELDPSWKCLDIDANLEDSVPEIQQVPFMYIICSFLPVATSGVANDTIFMAQDPDPRDIIPFCESTYGITPMWADELADKYRLSQAEYEASERILFVVGQYDPTTSLAPPYLPISANPHASKLLYVSNMAHREELLSPHPLDKPEVVQARAIEVETIKAWLGVE